jgi:acyl-CoA synthetase
VRNTTATHTAASTGYRFAPGAGGGNRDTHASLLPPDGPTTHLAYVAAERAGLVAIGIGPRSGALEAAHLLHETRATSLLTLDHHRGVATTEIIAQYRSLGAPIAHHFTLQHTNDTLTARVDGRDLEIPSTHEAIAAIHDLRLGPNELFFINSTSGTTGLPKCVMHTQNRWKYFHSKCPQFREDDVFLVVVPAPFGFGLWMGHFSPTMLGAKTVLMQEFDVDATLAAIEHHHVTVLAAVTTQVLMLLASPRLASTDLSSLRNVQSGGEKGPFGPAADFEQRTHTKVLQFYGSNEAGSVCGTTVDNPIEKRLGTAGRLFPEMHVRLFDDDDHDVTATGVGRCACKGPGITPGYYGNDEANNKLFRSDRWMFLGDIVEVDEDHYLSVIGRTADFIIRGGHNISAPAVEEAILAHPRKGIATRCHARPARRSPKQSRARTSLGDWTTNTIKRQRQRDLRRRYREPRTSIM